MTASAPAFTAVAIVGMHRSGTSCLSGCLEDCGLVLGEVNRAAEYNRKGNNENERLRAVHEAIFARTGHAWDRPPSAPIAWTSAEIAQVRAIIADYSDQPIWGFKDPRSLFLLDGWLELLPDLRLAGTFRHPAEVAASLANRDHFEPARSRRIWADYNTALLAWRERINFPIVFYDANSTRYLQDVRQAVATLGLNAAAPISFRDESLTHFVEHAEPPAELRPLWDRLQAVRIRV